MALLKKLHHSECTSFTHAPLTIFADSVTVVAPAFDSLRTLRLYSSKQPVG